MKQKRKKKKDAQGGKRTADEKYLRGKGKHLKKTKHEEEEKKQLQHRRAQRAAEAVTQTRRQKGDEEEISRNAGASGKKKRAVEITAAQKRMKKYRRQNAKTEGERVDDRKQRKGETVYKRRGRNVKGDVQRNSRKKRVALPQVLTKKPDFAVVRTMGTSSFSMAEGKREKKSPLNKKIEKNQYIAAGGIARRAGVHYTSGGKNEGSKK